MEDRSDLRVKLPDGSVVGYAETGDRAGQPVVYMHGRTSSRLEVRLPGILDAAQRQGLRVIAPDRPGIGLSTFRCFRLADYPLQVRDLADALGLGSFVVVGTSGGGKYACACASQLGERVTRVALVSSTCSFDLPGARATWSPDDRRVYPVANRAPWLVCAYLAWFGRDVQRHPDALVSRLERSAGPADREILAVQAFRDALRQDVAEAFRQGARGAAQDYAIEARPWGLPLSGIRVPIEIWHGEDDRIVSSEQARILARTLPLATEHLVPGEGHFSLFARHAEAVLRSVVASPPGTAGD